MEDQPVEEAEPGRAWGIGHVAAGVDGGRGEHESWRSSCCALGTKQPLLYLEAVTAARGARELVDVARAAVASDDVDIAQPYDAYYDGVVNCVEINQCVGCTKSFLGDDAAVLAPSSDEEPASPRHRAGGASMAWRSTRRFSTNAP